VDIQLNLNSETVSQAQPVEPLCVTPDTTVADVFALMRNHRTGSILICRDEVLVGVFTERDALRLMANRADLTEPISVAMTSNPVVVRVETTVGEAIQKMSLGGYRRLPIVDEAKRPVGVVKTPGVVRYLVEHFPQAVYNLPPVANQVSQHREGP